MLGDTRVQGRLRRPSFLELLRQAPRRFDEPTDEEAESFARCWTEITRQRVTPKMHPALRVIWRVHGAAAPHVVATRFMAKGTTTNLLADMLQPESESVMETPVEPRVGAPARDDAALAPVGTDDPQSGRVELSEGPAFEDWPDFWAQDNYGDDDWSSEPAARVPNSGRDLLPGLLYGESDRPPFDPKSRRRWDDRISNPDRDAILAERARASSRAAIGSAK
jgi:hypothetical protein